MDLELEAAKRRSTAQLLFKCARLVNERALSRLDVPARPAHTALFPHIDLEGTRLTEIAQRVGITKQAVGQLVDDLEEWGVVERIPDPADGRAKLIRWTKRGRDGLLQGLALLRTIEDEMRQVVGEHRMRSLHRTLELLHDWLTEPG